MPAKGVDHLVGQVDKRCMHYDVREAKKQLSELLAKVQAGEDVVIVKAGQPVARLLPVAKHRMRTPGTEKGAFWMAEDFDAPLPDFVVEGFDGRS